MKRIGPTAVFALAAAAGGFCAMVACGDDDAAIPPSNDAGALPPPTPNPTGNTPPTPSTPDDAGVEDDGGGSNPDDDPDSGLIVDEDGGYDAGASCDALPLGDKITTTCGTLLVLIKYQGGDLTTTDYDLTKLTVSGSRNFCSGDAGRGSYIEYDYRGFLRVEATDAKHAKLKYYDQHAQSDVLVRRPTPLRYDLDVTAEGATLTGVPTACKTNNFPGENVVASYTAATGKDGKTLVITLPYGRNGTARYEFTEHKE